MRMAFLNVNCARSFPRGRNGVEEKNEASRIG